MDDAVSVQLFGRFAKLDTERYCSLRRQRAALFHTCSERFSRYEVVHDDKVFWQLVGCLDMWEARRGAVGERGPNASAGESLLDFLAHEGAGSVDSDKLGDAVLAARENPFDAVGVVEAHGMHGLVVVQAVLPSR